MPAFKKPAKSKRTKVISSAAAKGMGRKWQPARDIISPTTGKKLKKTDLERKVEHIKPSEYVPARVPDEEHIPRSLRIMLAAREKAAADAARREEARKAAEADAPRKRARADSDDDSDGAAHEPARPRWQADPVPLAPIDNALDDDDYFVSVPTDVTAAAAAVAAEKAARRREPPRPEQKINRPDGKRREDTMTAAAAAHLALTGKGDGVGVASLKEQGIVDFDDLDASAGVAFGERYDAPPALTAVPRVRVRLSDAEVAAMRAEELKAEAAKGDGGAAGGSTSKAVQDATIAARDARAAARGGGSVATRLQVAARKAKEQDTVLGVTPTTFRRSAPLGYVVEGEDDVDAAAGEEEDEEDEEADEEVALPGGRKGGRGGAGTIVPDASAPPGSDAALLAVVIKCRDIPPGEEEEAARKRLETLAFATAALKARGVALPEPGQQSVGGGVKGGGRGGRETASEAPPASALMQLAAAARGGGGKGGKKMSSAQRHRVMMAVSLARASCGVHVRQLRGSAARAAATAAKHGTEGVADRSRAQSTNAGAGGADERREGDEKQGEGGGMTAGELRAAVRATATLDASHPERMTWIKKGTLSLKSSARKAMAAEAAEVKAREMTNGSAKAGKKGGAKGGAKAASSKIMQMGSLVECSVGRGMGAGASSRGSAVGTRRTSATGASRRTGSVGSVGPRSRAGAKPAAIAAAAEGSNIYAKMAAMARSQASDFETRELAAMQKKNRPST